MQAWRAQLKAGEYAYFDPRDLFAMFKRVVDERGDEVDLLCFFNDLRRATAAVRPGPLPTPEEIRAALPLTTLTWGPHTNVPDAQTFMEVNAVPDTVNLLLRVDTEVVAPEEQERIVREMAQRLRREQRQRAIEEITKKMAATGPAAEIDAAALISAMADGRYALDVLSVLAAQMVAAGALDMGEAADGIGRLRRIDTERLTQARRDAAARGMFTGTSAPAR